MTSDEPLIVLCDPCRWEFHEHCQPEPFCECLVTYCYERLLEAT